MQRSRREGTESPRAQRHQGRRDRPHCHGNTFGALNERRLATELTERPPGCSSGRPGLRSRPSECVELFPTEFFREVLLQSLSENSASPTVAEQISPGFESSVRAAAAFPSSENSASPAVVELVSPGFESSVLAAAASVSFEVLAC
eukprot:scaffold3388_cov264-Pinguiococcus_pyrenoidosus.AAC.7